MIKKIEKAEGIFLLALFSNIDRKKNRERIEQAEGNFPFGLVSNIDEKMIDPEVVFKTSANRKMFEEFRLSGISSWNNISKSTMSGEISSMHFCPLLVISRSFHSKPFLRNSNAEHFPMAHSIPFNHSDRWLQFVSG